MRTTVLQLAFAVLFAAGCSVDATKFSCTNSNECPSGYHCDLGTATAPGSLRCASGGAQQKTLAVTASKFFLAMRPNPDGSTRTTISADLGAVTSTPDFVGVRVIASQGSTILAESQVLSDGSVLQFQLPQPLVQVALRVEDDSGHSVPVTGYNQQVELSFAGREVAGTTNASAAYDVTTQNDSVFPPAAWIASGPGPGTGGKAKEFTATDTLGAGGAVLSSASYASIAYADYATAFTTSPPAPTVGSYSPVVAPSPVAWQPFAPLGKSTLPSPSGRVNATLASNYGVFYLFGGTDAAGTPADPQGAFYAFNTYDGGWTYRAPPAGQLPSARAGAAIARSASGGTCPLNGYVTPCDIDDYEVTVVGGQGASGTMTNEIQLFTRKRTYTSFNLRPAESTSWKLVGTLPVPNSGMQSAAGYVPFNAVIAGNNTTQTYGGGMMIYGKAVTALNSATNGCYLFGAAPTNPGTTLQPIPIQPNVVSCVGSPSAFDVAGVIGYRTGATLVADSGNPTTYYLFGGRKTTGATTALQNDIWKGVVTCVGTPPAACTTTTTWSLISGGGVGAGFPTPRAAAGGALWSQGRLLIHGGADANGLVNDLWEWDFGAVAWRQVPTDQTAGVLSPSTRLGFAMVGDLNQQQVLTVGGLVAGTATDQIWLTGRESTAKLLVKVPFSLPALDQAKNLKLTVDAAGTSDEQVSIWDGTTWRFLATSDYSGSIPHILASPTAAPTGFLQADGSIYLLVTRAYRNQPGYGSGFYAPISIDRLKMTVDFQ